MQDFITRFFKEIEQTEFEAILQSPYRLGAVLLVLSILSLLVPTISPIAVMAGLILLGLRWYQSRTYPLEKPRYLQYQVSSKSALRHDAKKCDGIFYLGRSRGQEVWASRYQICQHMMVLDSSVEDRQEVLLGNAANSLACGGGLLWIDGSGSTSLSSSVLELCKQFGRQEDFLILDFRDRANHEEKDCFGGKSLRFNPFAKGSSDSLTQLMISMMDEAGGDGAMWKGRATAMLTGVMRALCWMRQNGLIELDAKIVQDHLSIKKIIELTS